MNKYTAKQIAESEDLFEKQIHKVRKFYLSRNPDKMAMLEERKAVIKERNKGLSPNMTKSIIVELVELKTVRNILKPDIAFTVILITGFQRITNNKKEINQL